MNKTIATFSALGGAIVMAAVTATPAAAIQCKGRTQWNSAANAWIATPYCEDELIAAVARAKGMRVTGAAVRQNPNVKQDTCKFAGSDTRIHDLCAKFLPGQDNRYRP